jgi:hypothetical protein
VLVKVLRASRAQQDDAGTLAEAARMSVYRLGQDAPVLAASAYVAPNAAVIGKVILAPHFEAITKPSASAPAAMCKIRRSCTRTQDFR